MSPATVHGTPYDKIDPKALEVVHNSHLLPILDWFEIHLHILLTYKSKIRDDTLTGEEIVHTIPAFDSTDDMQKILTYVSY